MKTQIKKDRYLTDLQLRDYEILLCGLKYFTPLELSRMDEEEKRTITYNQNRAIRIVNRLKQEKLNAYLKYMLQNLDLCGNCLPLLFEPVTDSSFIVSKQKEFRVSRDIIIEAFIKAKLLPTNF